MPEPPCLAVAGSPILGSRSPAVFHEMYRASGINGHYTRISARSGEECITLLRELALQGMNITAPYKDRVLPLLEALDPDARLGGTVNTVMGGPPLMGANTDTEGALAALDAAGVDLEGRRVVVLGAGGAARAAVLGILRRSPAHLVVVNRTAERARRLAEGFGVGWRGLDGLEAQVRQAHVVVSCVSGDPDLVPSRWLDHRPAVLDADYRAGGLPGAARDAGCRLVPGSDWLAFQAAHAFRWFLGGSPPAPRQVAARDPERRSSIALVGFMGVGKSTVGRLLAGRLGWEHLDTDRWVEREAGASIPALFAAQGEAGFRARERRALDRVGPGCVVSVGGGALESPENRALLQERCITILLWDSLENLLPHLSSLDRPMLASHGASQLLEGRRPTYLSSADLVVHRGGEPPEATVRRILGELGHP